jgi:hypothetical protein
MCREAISRRECAAARVERTLTGICSRPPQTQKPATPDAVAGRQHADVQTENFLEEISDRPVEVRKPLPFPPPTHARFTGGDRAPEKVGASCRRSEVSSDERRGRHLLLPEGGAANPRRQGGSGVPGRAPAACGGGGRWG